MNNELKKIKDIYGEEMMHLCRELFPNILETPGLLLSILEKNLAPTHSFASDIKEYDLYDDFKKWIFSFVDIEEKELVKTNKTPFELMDEAGYTLYECKTEEDIRKFIKYYHHGEVLCTFHGGRLKRCHVFFAVKKNVNEIKRENYKNPKRQDEYGTSVISIQFSRGAVNDVSIKNRYNHHVNNPDCTFSNDLENIIPGLTYSFTKYYNFNIQKPTNKKDEFLTDELTYAKDTTGKFYRYNIESEGVYFCENNVMIGYDDNLIDDYTHNKERYILIDRLLIDRKEKDISDCLVVHEDAFVKSILSVGDIKSIDVVKQGDNRIIYFCYTDGKKVKIVINKHNEIIEYENNYVKKIDSYFLGCNKALTKITIPEVEIVADHFLSDNVSLTRISLPKVESIGYSFLANNEILNEMNLPEVKSIGDCFLERNRNITEVNLPKVKEIGSYFLWVHSSIHKLNIPEIETIGHAFGQRFLPNILSLPKLKKVGNDFLCNSNIIKLNLPNITEIGNGFLKNSLLITHVSLPKVQIIGDYFMSYNTAITHVDLPNVLEIGDDFLLSNTALKRLNLPKVISVGYAFLETNTVLSKISLPNIRIIDDLFLKNNTSLRRIDLPKVIKIGHSFVSSNSNLSIVRLPQIETIGHYFLARAKPNIKISMPSVFSRYNTQSDTMNNILERIENEKNDNQKNR